MANKTLSSPYPSPATLIIPQMSYLNSLNMMLSAKTHHSYYHHRVISRLEPSILSVIWSMPNWGGLSLHSAYSITITTV